MPRLTPARPGAQDTQDIRDNFAAYLADGPQDRAPFYTTTEEP